MPAFLPLVSALQVKQCRWIRRNSRVEYMSHVNCRIGNKTKAKIGEYHWAHFIATIHLADSLWAVSEVPTWHTDGAGMMGGGHFRYSDLKEAAAAADAYVI